MRKLKPKLIPISSIKPTEPLVPADKLEEIAAHYDGRVESIKPITGYQFGGTFYPDNGNKRAVFLYREGKTEIQALIQPFDAEEVAQLQAVHKRVAAESVHTIEDLAQRVFPRRQYEAMMRSYERKE